MNESWDVLNVLNILTHLELLWKEEREMWGGETKLYSSSFLAGSMLEQELPVFTAESWGLLLCRDPVACNIY